MNNSATNQGELNQKYSPLEMPDVLLKLIKLRMKYGGFYIDGLSVLIGFVLFLGAFLIKKDYLAIYLVVSFVVVVITFSICDKSARAVKAVKKQINGRKAPLGNELMLMWKTNEKYEIAKEINTICVEQIGWDKDTIFLPDDPFCLMVEAYTGDFGEIETEAAIEEVFSLESTKDFWMKEKSPGDLKFKDVVDYVLKNKK